LHGGDVDLATEHGRERGRPAVERHRGRLDAGRREQQFGRELAAGADAGGAELDRSTSVHQVLHGLETGLRIRDQHIVVEVQPGDDLVVVDVHGLALRHGEGGDVGQGAHEDHHGLTVWFGRSEFAGGDRAVRARLVLHRHGYTEVLARGVGERPADEVGATARILSDQHRDRTGGEAGRGLVTAAFVEVAATAGRRQQGRYRDARHEGEFHGALL
jgi:hypothetical protein